MHDLDICHLQINDDSVLVENQKPNNLGVKHNINKYVMLDDDIHISPRDRIVDTNSELHPIWYDDLDMPLRIKYTNFGIGCGKTLENGNIKCMNYDLASDRYLMAKLDGKYGNGSAALDISLGKQYDVWCMGKLIGLLIYKPSDGELLDPAMEPYDIIIKKMMCVALDARKDMTYINDMILSDEKDLNTEITTSETENLFNKIFNLIT